MINQMRYWGTLTIASWTVYLLWLITRVHDLLSLIYFFLEVTIFLLCLLFVVNHWHRKYILSGGNYSMRPIVDVFIPTKNESIETLAQTVQAAVNIKHPNLRIYLLDDGHRGEVEKLANKYEIKYLARPDAGLKRYKAANLNYGLKNSYGSFVLTIDADNLVSPNILDDLLGHFKDDKIAFVATRQRFMVAGSDFNNDDLFYEYMQTGKNKDSAAISCGSGVIYRRSALDAIGGFQDWNLVEDMYTSYVLHSHGFKSIYVNQAYTLGDAPTDLAVIYKQRGTWALDSLRMFFWKAPLLNFNLTFRQRLHYTELGYVYLISGLFIPAVYIINFYSLFTNDPIIYGDLWYVLLKGGSFYITLKFYTELGQGDASSRMWAALFPIYFKAVVLALLYAKPGYKVTQKGTVATLRLGLILPQLLMLGGGLAAAGYHIWNFGASSLFVVNVVWFFIMTYWIWPIFEKGLFVSGPKKAVQFVRVKQRMAKLH